MYYSSPPLKSSLPPLKSSLPPLKCSLPPLIRSDFRCIEIVKYYYRYIDPLRKATPPVRPLFHCRRGILIKGGIDYCRRNIWYSNWYMYGVILQGCSVFEECGGVTILEALDYHNNDTIRHQASELLDLYFYGESQVSAINVREYRRGNKKMDNPEKLATEGTQDETKQKHNTICVGHHYHK